MVCTCTLSPWVVWVIASRRYRKAACSVQGLGDYHIHTHTHTHTHTDMHTDLMPCKVGAYAGKWRSQRPTFSLSGGVLEHTRTQVA